MTRVAAAPVAATGGGAFGDDVPTQPIARTAGRPPRLPILITLAVVIAVVIGALGARGDSDGAVPDGVTVFDDEVLGVARLDPDLLGALRRAASEAADDRVEFVVNSGWRSAEYQERLFDEAVAKYGSTKEAARWVATADTSPHVSGDAIDIGPPAAAAWLSRHGGEYGLCQIYRNEPWHFELRPDAAEDGCPPRYADPTRDPRMQE